MDTFSSLTNNDPISAKYPTVGLLLTELLKYIYPAAGLLLLVTLIMGGITLMTAAGDQGKMKQGYGQITASIIGFVIIFVAYFIAQIIQFILGVKFL